MRVALLWPDCERRGSDRDGPSWVMHRVKCWTAPALPQVCSARPDTGGFTVDDVQNLKDTVSSMHEPLELFKQRVKAFLPGTPCLGETSIYT